MATHPVTLTTSVPNGNAPDQAPCTRPTRRKRVTDPRKPPMPTKRTSVICCVRSHVAANAAGVYPGDLMPTRVFG